MQVAKSLIPNSGNGVFCTAPVKKGDVVGEYFGQTFTSQEWQNIPKELDPYAYETDEKTTIIPDKACICQYINDAIHLDACVNEVLGDMFDVCEKVPTKSLIKKCVVAFTKRDVVCCFQDEYEGVLCNHNVEWQEKQGRVFLVAISDLEKGQELYVFYGWQYWKHQIVKLICETVFSE